MTSTWQLKCSNSTHIHNNSVLHYLYNMVVGLVIYSRPEHSRPKAQGQGQRMPRPKNLAWRPRPRINILALIQAPVVSKVDYCCSVLVAISGHLLDTLSQSLMLLPDLCSRWGIQTHHATSAWSALVVGASVDMVLPLCSGVLLFNGTAPSYLDESNSK